MFTRPSPVGTYCQVCDQPAVKDVYFYGDDLHDAIRRYDPDVRLCKGHLKELSLAILVSKAHVVMQGIIDCIMHSASKKVTASLQTAEKSLDNFPKPADVEYSKIWIVLDGSDPENPWWLEIERPMISVCEWKRESEDVEIRTGKRVRATLEVLDDE